MSQKEALPDVNTLSPFHRLQAVIADLIASTPPGERLPSEPELAKQLNASRATLREAMRSFEGQGLIRRRQGIGTFVMRHAHVMDTGLEILESIETLAKKIQLDVKLDDVVIRHIIANEELSEALNVSQGELLIQVSRVIMAEDHPVAYLIDVLPENVLSEAELTNGFTGSVLDILLSRGTPQLSESVAEIKAVGASPDIARALQIQRNDVLQLFVAKLYTNDGQVVDYSYSYFIPGVFRFHVVRKVGSNL
ncbi:MAG: GntR family transcriptional regulator [Anaerolineae bacterium]|nr:GntR family transcriptional regulator [Anaerolineae bacterium]